MRLVELIDDCLLLVRGQILDLLDQLDVLGDRPARLVDHADGGGLRAVDLVLLPF